MRTIFIPTQVCVSMPTTNCAVSRFGTPRLVVSFVSLDITCWWGAVERFLLFASSIALLCLLISLGNRDPAFCGSSGRYLSKDARLSVGVAADI